MKNKFYSREKAYRAARKESDRTGMSHVIVKLKSSTFIVSPIAHDGEETAKWIAEAIGAKVVDRTFGKVNS